MTAEQRAMLQRTKARLLTIEKRTVINDVASSALRGRLEQWCKEVEAASDGVQLGALFVEFIEGTSTATYDATMKATRAAAVAALTDRLRRSEALATVDSHVFAYRRDVIQRGLAAMREGGRKRRCEQSGKQRRWSGPKGAQGTSAFATSAALQEEMLRQDFDERRQTGPPPLVDTDAVVEQQVATLGHVTRRDRQARAWHGCVRIRCIEVWHSPLLARLCDHGACQPSP